MGIQELYSLLPYSNGVSIDTRTIKKGQIFFGLKGPRFDGNSLAAEALAKGAAYAVIDNRAYAVSERYLVVKDVLQSLQSLGHYKRKQFDFPVFGLTGSNGKTTTKELLVAALAGSMTVTYTMGNYNNHIGVPLTLLNAGTDADLCIVEMGTNQPGDIAQLCDIADPDIGMITNIGHTHLEKLTDRRGVFIEKKSLYDYVIAKQGDFFLNMEDDLLRTLLTDLPHIHPYSSRGSKDITLAINRSKNDSPFLSFTLGCSQDIRTYTTHLIGSYNLQNVASVLTIAAHFQLDLFRCAEGIAAYHPKNMRSQYLVTANNRLFMDAYNANPSSMHSSISDFVELTPEKGNRVLILGDMLELGENEDLFHSECLDRVRGIDAVDVYLVGPRFSKVGGSEFLTFKTLDELAEYLESHPIKNAYVLLKGSRGIGLERLIPYL